MGILKTENSTQFYHGPRADYCVYDSGLVTRTYKKSIREVRVAVYMRRGKACVKCGQKEFILKHLVASKFLPDYKKGMPVICVDGDEMNCNVENLCIMSNAQLGRLTGWQATAQAIKVKNKTTGKVKTFRSVREAAKSLNCSYQTVLDYLKGTYKNSCLTDFKITKVNNARA